MECSVCFCVSDVCERDSLDSIFMCKCNSACVCATCSARLVTCPWCRAPKRRVQLQAVVQREGAWATILHRKQFYTLVRELHRRIVLQERSDIWALFVRCKQFVEHSPNLFAPKEVYCLEDSGKAVEALLDARDAPAHSCCIFERVLGKVYEYQHGARPEMITGGVACTTCRFVHSLYGSAYRALSCATCGE